jgi:TetR/AcrR family transcriptional regulator
LTRIPEGSILMPVDDHLVIAVMMDKGSNMSLFEVLQENKQKKILQICLEEFARHGYESASTNSMARKAGIAKGSLFQYFGSKESLYFYVLDYAAQQLFEAMREPLNSMPDDIIERVVYIARLEFLHHLENPLCFQLFCRAQEDDTSPEHHKVIQKYGELAENTAQAMLAGAGKEHLLFDESVTVNAVLWLLKGFNESFVKTLGEITDPGEIEARYMKELEVYLEVLKKGIYKNKTGAQDA